MIAPTGIVRTMASVDTTEAVARPIFHHGVFSVLLIQPITAPTIMSNVKIAKDLARTGVGCHSWTNSVCDPRYLERSEQKARPNRGQRADCEAGQRNEHEPCGRTDCDSPVEPQACDHDGADPDAGQPEAVAAGPHPGERNQPPPWA